MKDRVRVQHVVTYVKNQPVIVGTDRTTISTITHHYLDGRVKLDTGDVWSVKWVGMPEYEYVTTGDKP